MTLPGLTATRFFEHRTRNFRWEPRAPSQRRFPMFLTIRQLAREDLRYLFCTDKQLADEVADLNHSRQPRGAAITSWFPVLPDTVLTDKEASPCPAN